MLFDGDFESGTLIGWTPSIQGTAILAAKGRCFSSRDTTSLGIQGNYAGLLRGSTQLASGTVATMTSKPFTAGKGFLFIALTEREADEDVISAPYALMVSVLDRNGVVLSMHELDTARVMLSPGCPSRPASQRFSEHFISTQNYLGQTIRLRFSQHPAFAQSGNFSLIDQVSIVQRDQVATYSDSPVAIAGIDYDAEQDFLYLIAKIPHNVLKESKNWTFGWHIDGESGVRASSRSCINDLKPGNYTASLSVRNKTSLSTDTLHFHVPERRQLLLGDDIAWKACAPASIAEPQTAEHISRLEKSSLQ